MSGDSRNVFRAAIHTLSVLDVTPYLAAERGAFLNLLRPLSADEWATPTECPEWDVKGIALHVLGDDLSLLSRQRDEATNSLLLYAKDHPDAPFRELLDGFNNQWVGSTAFLSTELVLELLELAGQWTTDYYSSVDLAQESNERVGFFGAGDEPSPWWQVSAREYAERWIHQHQIRRALNREALGDELSWPGVEAVVRGFGARNPALGRFRIGERMWEFGSGAEISLDPGTAITVLSRGLTLAEAIPSFQGDPAVVETVARQTSRDRYSTRS